MIVIDFEINFHFELILFNFYLLIKFQIKFSIHLLYLFQN